MIQAKFGQPSEYWDRNFFREMSLDILSDQLLLSRGQAPVMPGGHCWDCIFVPN